MQQISELNNRQKALLPEYKKKWQLAALSTESIDKQKATQAIKTIYKQISSVEKYDIYFFDSPLGIADLSFLPIIYPQENWCNPRKLNNLIRRVEKRLLTKLIGKNFWQDIISPQLEIVGRQVDIKLWHYLEKELHFWSPFNNLIPISLKDQEKSSSIWKSAKPNQQRRLEGFWFFLISGLVSPDSECSVCCKLDYCISELGCTPDEDLWQILKTFVADCGWTFFFQDFCFACDRPHTIIFEEQNLPQSERAAIIQFSDGFKILGELWM